MILSKSSEYAIRAIICILEINKDGTMVSSKDVSSKINSPEAFTAKLLQILVRKNIINSIKGPNGGFYIAKREKPIYLTEIIDIFEKPNALRQCLLGLEHCSDLAPCALHYKFKYIRKEISDMFEALTIQRVMAENKLIELGLR